VKNKWAVVVDFLRRNLWVYNSFTLFDKFLQWVGGYFAHYYTTGKT